MRNITIAMLAITTATTAVSEEFLAVNSSPFPINELVAFDPDNPGAADVDNPVAIFDGPFIRGIAMDSPTTGWAIQTADTASAPGVPGFYRIEDGGVSLVAAQPFGRATDTGGLAFDQNRTSLWAVIDPPTADSPNGDTLYRIGFDGSYQEIGEINIAGFGTSIRISGIATNPIDGQLYALDALTDSLYQIDVNTAQGTVVGAGLGVNLDNLTSGLDFTLDGSRLIAANNEIGQSTVYEIDASSGAVTSTLGVLPFSTSSISVVPEPTSLMLLAAGALLAIRRR